MLDRFIAYYAPSSPRAWRCFWIHSKMLDEEEVFSTCVEVFPAQITADSIILRLLHVRGGVSACSVR